MNSGQIAGIVLGSVVLVALIITGIIMQRKGMLENDFSMLKFSVMNPRIGTQYFQEYIDLKVFEIEILNIRKQKSKLKD